MIKPQTSFPDLRLARTSVTHGRHLPRWEAANSIYHVTFHLADSVPSEQLRIWQEERARLTLQAKSLKRALLPEEVAELKTVFNDRVEKFLCSGHGSCLLRNEAVSQIVTEVLTHSNSEHYALHAWCVMPNHLHVVVGQLEEGLSIGKLVSVWKSTSSHRINKLVKREGSVWQEDAYTRIIRDLDEYRNQMSYVWMNPESAGLTTGFRRERYVDWE